MQLIRASREGRLLKFAIHTALENTSFSAVKQLWQAADEIDVYHYAWANDHFQPVRGAMTDPNLESWVTLTALTTATKRIRVGSLVNSMVYRHPGLLAKMAVTLDIVSGGRLELSVGTGWAEGECAAYGIDLLSMRERFDRFEEGCQVLISLLTEESTTFQGRYYRFVDAPCEPKPVQKPHPPIVIGGTGANRTLRAVAKYGDHWNYPIATAEADDWLRLRDLLAERCAEIGRDPATITTSVSLGTGWSEPNAMAERAAGWREAGVDVGNLQIDPPCTPDDLVAVAQVLRPLTTDSGTRWK